MAVIAVDGSYAVVRLAIKPEAIEDLLLRHRIEYPDAIRLEALGADLIQNNFEPNVAKEFVRQVCEWGRGHRFVGRAVDRNSPPDIASALKKGYALALEDQEGEAVARIAQLAYLGQSFASKQLRFLVPDRAVILDSVIRTRMGYTETVEGYREFLEDCRAILKLAKASDRISREFRERLRVCDIETALFAQLQGY